MKTIIISILTFLFTFFYTNGQEPDMSMMFGGGGTVEVADFFEFNSSIDILMTTFDKKGKTNAINMTMLFPEDEKDYFGMEMKASDNSSQEMPPMKMVYDFKKSTNDHHDGQWRTKNRHGHGY